MKKQVLPKTMKPDCIYTDMTDFGKFYGATDRNGEKHLIVEHDSQFMILNRFMGVFNTGNNKYPFSTLVGDYCEHLINLDFTIFQFDSLSELTAWWKE